MTQTPGPVALERPRGARIAWGAMAAGGAMATLAGRWIPPEIWSALPTPCLFFRLTGQPCPFCGMSRAFFSAGAGDWVTALGWSPLGALLYPAVVALMLLGTARAFEKSPKPMRISGAVWIAIGAAVAANWIYLLGWGWR
ncbi:MAG: DUF2752 domain-containing protein [Kiritimatiellae bacterium]|nr:DUF2752 domain-containing protein [Kiritimatiellia bacterium]MDW8457743.1 DUF2752 domain-containing protein [Verrucomicrobiota bacterium]